MSKTERVVFLAIVVVLLTTLIFAITSTLNKQNQVHAKTVVSEINEQPKIEFELLKEFNQYEQYRMIDLEEGVVCYIAIDANTNGLNDKFESAPSQSCLYRLEK